VWIGVSVENQEAADERIWRLIDAPAKVRFVSVEPLLDKTYLRLDRCLTGNMMEPRIDWVIIGGESGNENGKYKYRPCSVEWIEDVIEHGRYLNLPFS